MVKEDSETVLVFVGRSDHQELITYPAIGKYYLIYYQLDCSPACNPALTHPILSLGLLSLLLHSPVFSLFFSSVNFNWPSLNLYISASFQPIGVKLCRQEL